MTAEHETQDGLAALAELAAQHGFELPGPRSAARTRRRRRRALLITTALIAAVLLVVGGYVGWTLTAPLSAPVAAAHAPAAPASVAAVVPLSSDGASAFHISGGADYFAGAPTAIHTTSGGTQPRTMASLTKIVTALVVLEARPLTDADDPGPTITFDKADHDLYDKYYVMGASIAPMPIGTRMSEYDALATMLIPSACNYAEALSTWAYGSQGAFIAATRDWLDAHHLTHTTIVEPTGLSHENTSTTADLLKIGEIAAADPVIAKIGATRSLSLPGPGLLRNSNDLLGTDGITGLKTGNLGIGSFCLLYTASLDVGLTDPLAITGVVLGGSTRASVDADVTATLDGIRKGFHTVQVATAGQQIGSYSTPWGLAARIVVRDDTSLLTWSDTPISVTMTTTTPNSYDDGQKVGTITWRAGPRTATADVEIDGTVTPPDAWWRMTHPFDLGAN